MPNYAASQARGSITLTASSPQVALIVGQVAKFDKTLKATLRAQLKPIGAVIVKDMQAEVRKPPLSGGDVNVGLRERIAGAIKARAVTTGNPGVTITCTDELALQYDGTMGRPWRHPVFGNTKVWVGQKGRPYFASVAARHEDDARKAILAAIDAAAKTLVQAP